MKKYIVNQLVIILIFNITTFAQNNDCNQSVWVNQFAKLLPKEICIPTGQYHITEVYKRVDLNDDGLEDCIIDWNKNPLQDGDTIYVTIYLQNHDSTFSIFRTFTNLYPIYFYNYSRSYVPQDKNLINIHKSYRGNDPLVKLTFKNNTIIIEMKEDAEANLVIAYKFDKAINNWRFYKSEEYFFTSEGYKPIDLSENIGQTIDRFTFFFSKE